ncbi:MAG: PorV/PorQ family protein [Elusimicrobiota bacterium]
MKKILYFIFVGIFFISGQTFGAEISAGSQFLRLGQGGRTVAMGEAYGGVADDVNSIFYNPAGLVQMTNPEILFEHSVLFENINMESLAVADRITENSAAGAAFFYLYSGDIEKYDRYGQKIGNSYNTDNSVITGSYARKIFNNTNAGINFKRISTNIEEEKSATVAVDVGILRRFNKLKAGLSIFNIGGKMQFVNAEESLPLNIKLGGSYEVTDNILLAADVNLPQDKNMGINVGGEYSKTFFDKLKLSLRGGFKTFSAGKISMGGGINWGDWDLNLAMVPYTELGSTFRVDLIKKFGAGIGSYKGQSSAELMEELEKLRSEVGKVDELKKELEDKNKELEQIQKEASRREEELQEKLEGAVSEEERNRLQNELKNVRREKEEAISQTSTKEEELRSQLNQREEELESLRTKLEERVESGTTEKQEIEEEVEEKEESLEEYKQQAQQRQQELQEKIESAPSPEEAQRLRQQLDELRKEQQKELSEKEKELEKLRQESSEKEAEINRLRGEIEELKKQKSKPPTRKRGTYKEALQWYRERIKTGPLPDKQKIKILESMIETYLEIEDEVPEMQQELEQLQ